MNRSEIQARIEKLKVKAREQTKGQKDRIERIRELFLKLKSGFDYMEKHPDNVEKNERLIKRAEPIFNELETLNVSQEFSKALLIFGPHITEILEQFEE